MPSLKILFACTVAVLLAACDATEDPDPKPSASVGIINYDNVDNVLNQVFTGLGSVTLVPDNIDNLLKSVDTLISNGLPEPLQSQSYPCPASGMYDLTLDYSSLQTLSAGDLWNVTFNDCDTGAGLLVDGQQDGMLVTAPPTLQSSTGLTPFEVNLGFNNLVFSATAIAFSVNVNGILSLKVEESAEEATLQISGDSLAATVTSNSESDTIEFSDFLFHTRLNHATQTLESEISGAVDTTVFEPSLEVTTVAPLLSDFSGGFDFGLLASSGQIKVTASDLSNVLMTIDSGSVTLDIDEDGDGVVDDMKTVNLSDLLDPGMQQFVASNGN